MKIHKYYETSDKRFNVEFSFDKDESLSVKDFFTKHVEGRDLNPLLKALYPFSPPEEVRKEAETNPFVLGDLFVSKATGIIATLLEVDNGRAYYYPTESNMSLPLPYKLPIGEFNDEFERADMDTKISTWKKFPKDLPMGDIRVGNPDGRYPHKKILICGRRESDKWIRYHVLGDRGYTTLNCCPEKFLRTNFTSIDSSTKEEEEKKPRFSTKVGDVVRHKDHGLITILAIIDDKVYYGKVVEPKMLPKPYVEGIITLDERVSYLTQADTDWVNASFPSDMRPGIKLRYGYLPGEIEHVIISGKHRNQAKYYYCKHPEKPINGWDFDALRKHYSTIKAQKEKEEKIFAPKPGEFYQKMTGRKVLVTSVYKGKVSYVHLTNDLQPEDNLCRYTGDIDIDLAAPCWTKIENPNPPYVGGKYRVGDVLRCNYEENYKLVVVDKVIIADSPKLNDVMLYLYADDLWAITNLKCSHLNKHYTKCNE